MKMIDIPPAVLTSATLPARGAAEPAAIALSDLGLGAFATIHAVLPAGDDAERDLVLRLIEIGFVPGERVRVTAIGRPGREPIAVRLVGGDSGRGGVTGTTFAMRRHEADFIRVVPDVDGHDVGATVDCRVPAPVR